MYCPSCGGEVPDDSTFCRHCGEELDPESEPEGEGGEVPTAEPEPEESETSTLMKLGYWGGRVIQIVLIGGAVILVAGTLNQNVIQFIAGGVFALVLLGFAGVIEVLVVRPSSG